MPGSLELESLLPFKDGLAQISAWQSCITYALLCLGCAIMQFPLFLEQCPARNKMPWAMGHTLKKKQELSEDNAAHWKGLIIHIRKQS